MFDFHQMFNQGRRFTVNGEEWVSLYYIGGTTDIWHLAARAKDVSPAPVFMIAEPKRTDAPHGEEGK